MDLNKHFSFPNEFFPKPLIKPLRELIKCPYHLYLYRQKTKRREKKLLDTQLFSNILKQVCMCCRALILNSCVVYVVHSVIVMNSIFLLIQLTSPA